MAIGLLRRARRCGAIFLLGLAMVAGAPPAEAQTAGERGRIEQLLERGRLLFGMDRAAWVATDDMFARLPDPRGAGVRGYIVEPHAGGFDVIFHGGSADKPVQIFRARVGASGVERRETFPAGTGPALTPLQRRMAQAITTASRSGPRPCIDRPFNPLAIAPDRADGPVEVYLMTPQIDAQLPMGGHYKVTIAADGKVTSSRPFTNSCILLPDPEGSAGLMISHLLDPLPTEIHIFSAMAAGVPLYVATSDPDRLWEVTGEAITEVSEQ